MIARKRALDLLSLAGMPWRFAHEADIVARNPFDRTKPLYRHSWTGHILLVTADRSGTDLIHEFCHWLIAPIRRRSKPEFGLGASQWSDLADRLQERDLQRDLRLVSHDKAYDEEIHACLLDVYLHRLLRGGWRSRAKALSLTWNSGSWKNFLAEQDDNGVAHQAGWNRLHHRGLVRRAAIAVKRVLVNKEHA